jgi:apolipoprotein N-acyltransferase
MRLSPTHRAALGTGALLAASSLPGPFGPLAFVAPAPLIRALLRGVAPMRALGAGLLAGLVHGAVAFAWLPFAEVGAGPPPLLAYLALLPILAAASGAFAFGLALLAARSGVAALAAAPGLWAGLEYARSQGQLGVPWSQLGYGLADWPALSQAAGWVGLYGLSFWIVAVSARIAGAKHLAPGLRTPLALVLAAPLIPGAALLADALPGDALRVVAVQPGLGERERRDPQRFAANLIQLHAASERALSAPAQLVVWPESAWQRPLGGGGDAFLAALAHDLETPILTGVWGAPGADRRGWRNLAVVALPDGRTPVVAEKQHPVPIYERSADGPLARWLARRGLWSGQFERGRASDPFALPRAGGAPVSVGVLVCIDASHPEVARQLRRAGARLLVAIANEAASGRWPAALHARVTRLRAIESGVPIVRVASRGPSLWIDARGRVIASLPAGGAGSAGHALALASAPARFVDVGDAWVAAAAALSAAVAACASRLPLSSREGVPA